MFTISFSDGLRYLVVLQRGHPSSSMVTWFIQKLEPKRKQKSEGKGDVQIKHRSDYRKSLKFRNLRVFQDSQAFALSGSIIIFLF
jgi:hypothetical protein